MPVATRILPRASLVLVTYSGVAGIDESLAAIRDCAADPNFQSWFAHLVDLRAVTGYERDIAAFFAMQAQAIDHFPITADHGHSFRMVMIAPPGPARGMAELVRRTWEGLGHAIVLVQEDEAGALAVLGQPHDTIDALRAAHPATG